MTASKATLPVEMWRLVEASGTLSAAGAGVPAASTAWRWARSSARARSWSSKVIGTGGRAGGVKGPCALAINGAARSINAIAAVRHIPGDSITLIESLHEQFLNGH